MLPPASETMEMDAATKAYRAGHLVAFWLEGMFYGLYFFLFLAALSVIGQRDKLKHFPAKVQLAGIVVMFILITLHNVTNLYRIVRSFAVIPLCDPRPGAPILNLRDWQTWDYTMFGVIGALITWLGDVLVIYRCYIVWQKDIRIIILPCLMLVTCISATSLNLRWFQDPSSLPFSVIQHTLPLVWALNLAQNTLTTGLIIYRICAQHFRTVRAALTSTYYSGAVSLLAVSRIMIESAAIYTLIMFLLCIFWVTGNPAFVTMLYVIVPITGIVFVLMPVRIHIAQIHAESVDITHSWTRTVATEEVQGRNVPTPGVTPSTFFGLPRWLEDDLEELEDLQFTEFGLEDRRDAER